MGLIRLILAAAVIAAHTGSIMRLKSVGGELAVQCFFIISGFYMAMILTEKYVGPKSYFIFLKNRFLKLFPVYWVVLGLTFLLCLINHHYRGNYLFLENYMQYGGSLNPFSYAALILSNLLIFGQSVFCFLGLDLHSGAFYFTQNFRTSSPAVYTFLLVPQAWSIELELLFYILAPFIIKFKTRLLIILMAILLAARLYFYFSLHLDFDPWTYRFFPFELIFFFAGILSYRLYKHLERSNNILAGNKNIFLFIVSFILLFQFLPGYAHIKNIVLPVFLTFSIPFIFEYTKSNKWDRIIGDYSYPIYISHIMILALAELLFNLGGKNAGIIVLIGSIAVSWALNHLVAYPLERIRKKQVVKLHNPALFPGRLP